MDGNSSTKYDLLILTDATGSMYNYLRALHESLPKIIAVSALSDSFSRIGVLAYRDYSGGDLTEWSGWYGEDGTINRDDLIRFTKGLKACHGGDFPEATKTGLARAHSVMRSDAKTLVILYTDAPPHMPWNNQNNRIRERDFLREVGYGETSPLFSDWVSAVRTMQQGEKQAQVFAIVGHHAADAVTPYTFMCHETLGCCFEIDDVESEHISTLTMAIILTWLGVHKPGTSSNIRATLREYIDTSQIHLVKDENDPTASPYFISIQNKAAQESVESNTIFRLIGEEELRISITPRATPVQDFSKRYVADEKYRAVVVEHLGKIIEEDVSAIAVNPVFGSLWRVVCNDRENDARDILITRFGGSIERIRDENRKLRMKTWLAESYDYKQEITAAIRAVRQEDQYPCVFLDPTEDWSVPSGEEGDNDNENHSPRRITTFTRDELLEIGRSCDYRILRRLGRVLTRLTYVASEEAMPAHIKAMTYEEAPRLPLALAREEHSRVFWKILLHAVLPGTKLAARQAALLAALSIRMGMRPLTAVADAEMVNWGKQWNKLDIPETWNANCLSLILDADKSFGTRRKAGEVHRDIPKDASFLSPDDRLLFERLVDYSLLKANMSTTLQARIGWEPEKTKVPVGPLAICRSCKYPRSVTVMAEGQICGICACPESGFSEEGEKGRVVHLNVSQDHTESTEATWVECNISTCRAQYIVYDPASLNVRPKCHYCRQKSQVSEGQEAPKAAPWIECTKCLNRMIWPTEYRPEHFSVAEFQCPACAAGRETIVGIDTTPTELSGENGTGWLLHNADGKIPDPFGTRSLFKTISAAGVDDFTAKVEVLPSAETAELTHRGKTIHNTADMKADLHRWIKSRRAEAGTCSLCFTGFPKGNLRSACGRSGCQQPICAGCRREWYGLNGRGRIINVAALSCPFCRRQPAPRAAGGGIVLLGNLRDAIEEAGTWIYAWCDECGLARRFSERVCAQGAPPELWRWQCDECGDRIHGRGREGAGGTAGSLSSTRIKDCPGCATPTEKLGGCDHIECAVPGCGTHWCFFCGLKVPRAEIYMHMAREHGGWYDGQSAEEYDTDETDETDDEEYN